MKRFTRPLFVAVMVFAFTAAYTQQSTAPAASTQTRPSSSSTQRPAQTPESVANAQIEWMKTDLKLNDATLAKVSEVVLRITKVRLEERNKVQEAGGDMAAMMAKSDEYYAKMDAELKPILGDATYATYIKEAQEKRAASRQGMSSSSSSSSPSSSARPASSAEATANSTIEWMKTDLKLDAATLTKVTEIVTRVTKTRIEERDKVRTAGGDQAAIDAKSDEYYAKMDAELKPVLGDATYAIYIKEAKEKRAAGRAQRSSSGTTQGAPTGTTRQ